MPLKLGRLGGQPLLEPPPPMTPRAIEARHVEGMLGYLRTLSGTIVRDEWMFPTLAARMDELGLPVQGIVRPMEEDMRTALGNQMKETEPETYVFLLMAASMRGLGLDVRGLVEKHRGGILGYAGNFGDEKVIPHALLSMHELGFDVTGLIEKHRAAITSQVKKYSSPKEDCLFFIQEAAAAGGLGLDVARHVDKRRDEIKGMLTKYDGDWFHFTEAAAAMMKLGFFAPPSESENAMPPLKRFRR